MNESSRFVVIRADSGSRIGSGHVVRCLTLARELRTRSCEVKFACRPHAGHLIDRIVADGFAVDRLPGVDADALETTRAFGGRTPDWVICDHYELDEGWEEFVSAHTKKMLVIEDLPERKHVSNALLDQNWYGEATAGRYAERVSKDCICLLGPRFALLAAEYSAVRNAHALRDGFLRRVLVFFGGSDATDETSKAVLALARPEFHHIAVDIVLGGNHPNREAVKALAATLRFATVYENLPTLAGLMSRADLAIGAGGSTSWERMCLDLPSIVTTIAKNQEPFTHVLADEKRTVWLGDTARTTVESYAQALKQWPPASTDAAPLVDGYGAKRVAECLSPSTGSMIALRVARPSDAVLFFDWRNDSLARKMSFNSDPIDWRTHRQWFERRLNEGSSRLFVAEVQGLPIGQVRLDYESDSITLSYALDPLVRGKGWSRQLILMALSNPAIERDRRVVAHVRVDNEASSKIFRSLGWKESRAIDSLVFETTTRQIDSSALQTGLCEGSW